MREKKKGMLCHATPVEKLPYIMKYGLRKGSYFTDSVDDAYEFCFRSHDCKEAVLIMIPAYLFELKSIRYDWNNHDNIEDIISGDDDEDVEVVSKERFFNTVYTFRYMDRIAPEELIVVEDDRNVRRNYMIGITDDMRDQLRANFYKTKTSHKPRFKTENMYYGYVV